MNRSHPFTLRQNKPNFEPIEDHSSSRLVAGAPAIRVKLSTVPARRELVGISDFDILNFVLPPGNYAKQTQFPKSQNKPNPLLQKGLDKYMPSQAAGKQTQFHPQNKPQKSLKSAENHVVFAYFPQISHSLPPFPAHPRPFSS